MKKVLVSAFAAIALSVPVLSVPVLSVPALAADLPARMPVKAAVLADPSPWDIAFGAAVMNDYIFRGITQSNHRPSVSAYFEPRYNINKDVQLYAGVSGESIDFPNHAAAEIDFYGGIRPTFGALALDFGAWYYYYPGGQCFNTVPPGSASDCTVGLLPNLNAIKKDLSFFEVYAKGTYTFSDNWAAGANFYYTPSYLNSGADGEYVSGTLKYTAPSGFLPHDIGWYASGEFGRQFLGTSDAFYGTIDYKDYNTWNAGVGFTYKVFTLDLRYYDTDLNKGDCNAFTSDHTAGGTTDVTSINPTGVGSSWCGATFVAKFSADLTLGSLK